MNSNEKTSEFLEIEKQIRIKIKREEWILQQQLLREHEKRKLKLIKEYERKRAETLKNMQRSSQRKSHSPQQRSKSHSPQQQKILSIETEHSKDFEMSKYSKDTIIDKNELHKIKITIHRQSNTKDQSTSEKIERDIVNVDDIILPRQIGEGYYPIFKRIKDGAHVGEIQQSVSVSLKKQLPMNIDTHGYSADERNSRCDRSVEIEEIENKISSISFEEEKNLKKDGELAERERIANLTFNNVSDQHLDDIKILISDKLMRHQDEVRITDNYKHKSRCRSREKKDRNEKRSRSHSSHSSHSSHRRHRSRNSHYSNSATSTVKDGSSYRRRYSRRRSNSRSREEKDRNKKRDRSNSSHNSHSSYTRHRSHSSHYRNSAISIVKDRSSRRNKSSSPMDKHVREKRIDNYKNQSSSRPLSRSLSRSPFQSSSKNPDKSREQNDRVSLECSIQNLPMNYSLSYPVYNNYLFLKPSQMFKGQAPPMIWSIRPRPFPMPYPPFPPHMIRWRKPPPRFVNNINRAHHPH